MKSRRLRAREAGGAQEDFYSVTLEDVLISSYQSGGHGGSTALPTDQFSLNYAKIKFVYQPQDSKGKLGGAVPFEYDLKAGVSK